ncbi:MAG: ModE family transcriptional regulator [Candidatus Methanomethylicota archaeon]|uniref:ModE family transcriptional regulator n=1 Tax=Thermoproteota archaeon TaxID=2056631 RepID=A0A497EST4_9CREN|nr:MAG: ModE family transcriptional regulator [Candidatus Verstraetearchaeota archaeon]
MSTSLDKGYRAAIRTWLEKDHQPILGEGRALILEAIEKTGSISAAAKMLGMPYRYVWRKLAKIEEVLGQPVVMTRRSGVRGGGAELTHVGKHCSANIRSQRILPSGY